MTRNVSAKLLSANRIVSSNCAPPGFAAMNARSVEWYHTRAAHQLQGQLRGPRGFFTPSASVAYKGAGSSPPCNSVGYIGFSSLCSLSGKGRPHVNPTGSFIHGASSHDLTTGSVSIAAMSSLRGTLV